MSLQRYDAAYRDIDIHDRGDYVKLEDVLKMLEDGKLIDHDKDNDYELGWNAGIDALLKELNK